MIIVSGVMPGGSGVGRLLTGLARECEESGLGDVAFVTGGTGAGLGKSIRGSDLSGTIAGLMRMVAGYGGLVRGLYSRSLNDTDEPLVIVHPQSLTRAWLAALMRRRTGSIFIYLMDNSFFCLRSYNYIPGEDGPCTRCLGGELSAAREMGCRPFPPLSFGLRTMLRDFREWESTGRLVFLVQCETQAGLVRSHFGDAANSTTVGIFASDFPRPDAIPDPVNGRSEEFDVVFHGSADAAKGVRWALELARLLPARSFMFPFHVPHRGADGPPATNAVFRPMGWESGLADAVRNASLVLNPSLWSAPIEGALVKSIIYARRTAVVEGAASWSSELPSELVLRLSSSLPRAAEQVEAYLSDPVPIEYEVMRSWYEAFYAENGHLLTRIRDVVLRQPGDTQ